MCFCEKPTINGTAPVKMCFEYPANNYQPNPPKLQDGDTLLFDEPGRCGGLDHHSHHFRIVKNLSSFYLLVQHGGGSERIRLFPLRRLDGILATMDSDSRYWMLATIYSAYSDGEKTGRETTGHNYRSAIVEKRIKVRRRRGLAYVDIIPKEVSV